MKKIIVSMLLVAFFSSGVSFAQTQSSSSSSNILQYPQIHFPSQTPPHLSMSSKNGVSHRVKSIKKPATKKQVSSKKKPIPKGKKTNGVKPTPSVQKKIQ